MSGKFKCIRLWWWIPFIIFAACSPGNQIKVDSMNFDNQVDMYQNLEITFNHELAPDSLLNKWDSTQYLTLTPEIKGRFQWTSVSTLVFSPSVPFAPNTDYRMKINPVVSKYLTKRLETDENDISFHTPYLSVERSQTYWGIDENNPGLAQLRISLNFNHPVDINNVRKYVSVKIDNQPVLSTLLTRENGNEMVFSIEAPGNDPSSKNLSVTISKGMSCIGSARVNPDNEIVELSLPQRDRLEISDIITDFEEGEGVVYIFTSQPVISQGLRTAIKVSPDAQFDALPIGNGFKLKGNFADGKSYELTISGRLKGIFGPELGADHLETISFGSLEPYIAFADQSGMYLSPGGSGNLGINIINVPTVRITVFKVFENNIQHFMRIGKQWNWDYEDDEYHDSYAYSLDEDYGKVVSTRELDTRALPRKGNIRLLNLRPEQLELSNDLKGIYLVKVESTEKKWLSDVQLISYSDIGLIVKEGLDDIFVAARSIATAQPLPGVAITLVSRNNQQVYKLTTDRNGIAELKNLGKTIPGFKISMISARKDQDFNVLLFNKSQIETSRFDVGGKRTAGQNYDVFIYGDRNLYRPGDSVFCNALVRSFKWDAVQDIPVKFRVIAPDGKDYIIRRAQLSKTGSAQLSFRLPESALTGGYIIEVLASNDVLIGNYRIGVEEFMPDRIKAQVKTDKESYFNGEVLRANTTATNLFGPPAANRKIESELRISRKDFIAKGYENFNFSITTPTDIYFENSVNESTTDAKGMSEQQFTLPDFAEIGLLSGRLFTTVFDETGRPVNRYNEVEILTQSTFYGIGPVPGWVSTGRPLSIHTTALNRQGKAVKGDAKLEVVSIRWETVLERNYGSTNYRSQRKEKVILARNISIGTGGYNLQFLPPVSGEYEVRISSRNSSNFVKQSFYAYGWADAGTSSFQVNREGEIDIEADKASYKPGETARLLFKTPFAGELLITIEQNKVLEYYSIPANAQGANLDLKIRDEFMPNAYIGATLIRKIDNSGLPLTVAHGFASVKVEKPERRLNVTIDVPEKQRSKRNQLIKVKTSPGAEVTIAAVDEGILQITGYSNPDPYSYFYQKRALEVNAYDLFGELFPELSSGHSSSGGDRGFDMGKRLNPLTSKRVKLLARWSGTLKADANGNVNFNLPIPQFSGAIRVMAVAFKGNEFGSAGKTIKVADPLVISSSLPRFLSPSDKAIVGVTLTNTTSKSMQVKLSTKATGPVKCGPFTESSVTVPANSEASIAYHLDAATTIGKAKIQLSAIAAGEEFTEETDISIRPAVTLTKTGTSGQIKPGEKIKVKAQTDFLNGTASSRLLLTKSPAGLYAHDLNELINYPYGCLEQTVSIAFPQLYFSDLVKLLKQKPKAPAWKVDENIREAILKIEGLQQYNGGLAYWPSGYSTINWWSTAYAGNFLYEATKAGYSVNPKVTESINRYLTEMVKQKGSTDYFYTNSSGGWIKKTQPNREIFYSLYVLALSGKQHIPTMNYYKARLAELSNDSRYMLACSYALTGDMRSFETVLPKSWDNKDQPGWMTGGCFSSPVRDKAIALYTLINADIDNPQVALLARQLGEMMHNKQWLSTQERAFAMLALGKLAGMSKPGNAEAQIESGGRKIAGFRGDDLITDITGTEATITASGKGTVFYYLESEGIPLSGNTKEEDRILKVRRTMLNRNGETINTSDIKQNDLIVVAITISTTDNSSIENVAITDILPAGFEIENTRLNTEREISWIKNRAMPDYQDIRDDRISFFTTATGQSQTFYYQVRAVSKGTFVQGPVGADAMYNGQYYSYSGAGKVVIH
ncbi:MAG: alpha-2-macroglobulin family protein [Lentimicrobiaceae bacterium]|nr:alpha-2-macroglobulin family protein [Lentimicrobiaceae bacterium]